MPHLREVVISVERDEVFVDPDIVTITRSKCERVFWHCNQGDIEIQFKKDESPFTCHRFEAPQHGAVVSPIPKRRAEKGKLYKYTVIVTIGKDRFVKDPGVFVD